MLSHSSSSPWLYWYVVVVLLLPLLLLLLWYQLHPRAAPWDDGAHGGESILTDEFVVSGAISLMVVVSLLLLL